jgi:hypothetical protein
MGSRGQYDAVYVYYPRGQRTGGPEALHQLVDGLRSLGQEAYLTPVPGTEAAPRAPEFAHYDAPEAARAVDARNVAVVSPEVYLRGLVSTPRSTNFCWWLSIDNSPFFSAERTITQGLGSPATSLVLRRQLARQALRRWRWRDRLRHEIVHLTQSHYAWSFLFTRLGALPTLVTDYTVLTPPTRPHDTRKVPVVAYNPTKSGELVDRLKPHVRRRVEWAPLQGLTPDGVAARLSETDVYLDLGHHPGKDRLPREAALAGAVVLVARRGSAAFTADVPLPHEHKIHPGGDLVAAAATILDRVLSDPAAHAQRQAGYRQFVRAEREKFTRELQAVFVEGQLGLDQPVDHLPPDA